MSVFQDEIGFLRGAYLSVACKQVGIRRPVNTVEQPT